MSTPTGKVTERLTIVRQVANHLATLPDGVYCIISRLPLRLVVGLDGKAVILADSADRADTALGEPIEEWERIANIDEVVAGSSPESDRILKSVPNGWLEEQARWMSKRAQAPLTRECA
jgi:hypothetical protein